MGHLLGPEGPEGERQRQHHMRTMRGWRGWQLYDSGSSNTLMCFNPFRPPNTWADAITITCSQRHRGSIAETQQGVSWGKPLSSGGPEPDQSPRSVSSPHSRPPAAATEESPGSHQGPRGRGLAWHC